MMHATILRTVDTETQGTIVDPNRAPKLIDPNTNQIVAILKSAYDVIVTDDMITGTAGQEVLDFKMPFHARERDLIKTEMIIEVMGSRFHVRTPWDGWDSGSPISIASIHCEAEWYLLGERDPITMPKQTTAHNAIATIIGSTGWTLGAVEVSAPGGSLTITDQMSPLAALRLVPQAFGGELEFDNIGKVVHLRAQRGSSSVVTMYAHGRNLVGNARTEDTTNLVTRLYVQGAQAVDSKGEYVIDASGNPVYVDITSVNGGLPYLEDYSFYINRSMPGVIRAATVSADTITDPQTLKDWGAAQLAAMSQAAFTYQIQQSNTGVDDVEVALGDVVRVHDDDLGTDVNARIQGRVINVMQPWLTTYTIDTGLFTLSNALVGIGGGTVIQGGGGATASDSTIPNAPASVSIVATATAADYSSVLVQVEASWAQVTANTDSTLIGDLDHYDVEYQLTTHDLLSGTDKTSAWTRQSVSAGSTSALITMSGPNIRVTVRVRAVDTSGNASSWTTQGPQVILPGTTTPPTPSTPTLVAGNNLPGIVTTHWDGNTSTGTATSIDTIRLDVHVGSTAGFVPTTATLVDQLTAAGNSVLSLAPGTWFVKFIAVNSSLQQSAPSAGLQVTTRQIVGTDVLNATIKATNLSVQVGTGNLQPNSYWQDTTHVSGQGSAAITVPPSTERTYQGEPVLKVVATSTGSNAYQGVVQTDKVPVEPLATYSSSVWVFNPGATALVIYPRWTKYTATGTFISETGPSVTIPPGVWTRTTSTFTADATCGLVQFSTQWPYGSIPAAGTVTYYLYGLTLTRGDLPVDASRLVLGSLSASVVRAENLAVGAIQAVSIATDQGKINSAQIGSASISSLVAGTLLADMSVSARIKTADTGARAEMSGTGFYLIDGAGNQLLSAKIVSGVASIDIIGNIKAGSSLPITTYTEQLLPNGNFEDLDLNGFPQYWALDFGTAVGTSESTNPLSGSRSFTVSVTGNTSGAGFHSTKYVPVSPGERLIAKIDFRANGAPVAGQNSIYLRVHWRDAAGALITGSNAPLPISPQILSVNGAYVATPPTASTASSTDISSAWTGWTAGTVYRIAGEVTVPPGAVYVDVGFFVWTTATVGGAATFTFDNAHLSRSGVGNSIRSGYVTGAWIRTGESGKRIEMGTDRGATYAYNVMYFYSGWTANGVGESITFGPFYGAVQSNPMQGYVAVDVTTETGGTSPTGRIMGNLRLQSPKLTADTVTDTWAALQVHSTILDTNSGALVADSDAVQVFASKFHFLGSAKGENQVILQSWLNNQRIALLFRNWDGTDSAVISTVTAGGNYGSGTQIGDVVLASRRAGAAICIGAFDGGSVTRFWYQNGMTVVGSNAADNALTWRGTTAHVLGSTNWANTAWGAFYAAAYTVQSSLQSKADIEPIEPGWARERIQEAPAYRWKYVHEDFADSVNGDPDKNGHATVRAAGSEDWHFSPMYEHLHEDVRESDSEGVDLRDLIGIEWAALSEVFGELDALRAEVRELREKVNA